MKTKLLVLFFSVALAVTARAGSATWNLNPVSNLWFNASNWTPAIVPNGTSDVATFGVTNLANISDMGDNLSEIVFKTGASSYQITAQLGSHVIDGPGVTNNSGTQKFVVVAGQGEGTFGEISFTNSASAGFSTDYTINGTNIHAFFAGDIAFHNTASAGFGIFTTLPGTVEGSIIFFFDTSTAGTGTFFDFGDIAFESNSTADMGYFEIEGATVSGGFGGTLELGSHGGAAQFVINAGTVAGAPGGEMAIQGGASAENATIFANDGPGGGGIVRFIDISGDGGGEASFQLNGKGTLDASDALFSDPSIGSLSGSGLVFLGARKLTIGTNNTTTAFTGVIQDGGAAGGTGGSIVKTGTGQFSFDGANVYTGGTTVSAGILRVENTTGSATGTGPVLVANAGVLGGGGIVSGPVTIGGIPGGRPTLSPGRATKVPRILTLQGPLTLSSPGRYSAIAKISQTRLVADQVNANGVSIGSGATFILRLNGRGTPPLGKSVTVINNTSVTPISGTFANLADGAIITVNGNNLQADYEGGDGNDLTLTVVP